MTTQASPPEAAGELSSSTNELQPVLSTPGLIVHYITSVIGVGVLIIPGHAAHIAGPLALVAWLALIIYSYPFALIFARLSTQYPTSRGITEFVETAYGARFSRLVSIFLMLTLVVANPVLGLAAGRYLLSLWYADPTNTQVIIVGFGVILLSIFLNLLGVRLSTRVQGTLLGALVLFLVLVMVLAIPSAEVSRLQPFAPHGWQVLGETLIICFYGFIGWENAAPVAEEVINPKKTFPRAILGAVLIVGALYFAMALTVVLVLPGNTADATNLTVFISLLQTATGQTLAQIGDIVAVVLLVLAMNAWVLGTSRVVFNQARDGVLPASLGRVVGRRGVPRAALLSLVLGYGVPVGLLLLSGQDEGAIITASSAAFLLLFTVCFLSARRLLSGRMIRVCIYLVLTVTVAIIPFFGMSLVAAVGIFAISLVVDWFTRRSSGAASVTAKTLEAAYRRSPPDDGISSPEFREAIRPSRPES